jgi:hypothetical protein
MKMFWIGLVFMCLSTTGIILSIIIPLGKPEVISEFSGFGLFVILYCSSMFLLTGAGMAGKALDLSNKTNIQGETKCQT